MSERPTFNSLEELIEHVRAHGTGEAIVIEPGEHETTVSLVPSNLFRIDLGAVSATGGTILDAIRQFKVIQ